MRRIKQRRVAEKIRTKLSELFLRDLKDPRLEGVTITKVNIDRELMYANIYVQALGEDEREDEVMDGLEAASGYLRHQLAGTLRLRTIPHLRFHWDPTLAHAERINKLLDSLDIPDDEAE